MTIRIGLLAAAAAASLASAQILSPDAPDVGQVVPDVSLYDDQGAPVSLHGLEGKYRVLVFGCLT